MRVCPGGRHHRRETRTCTRCGEEWSALPGQDVCLPCRDAARRAVRRHVVHLRVDGAPRCGRDGASKLSDDPAQVTCRLCLALARGASRTWGQSGLEWHR